MPSSAADGARSVGVESAVIQASPHQARRAADRDHPLVRVDDAADGDHRALAPVTTSPVQTSGPPASRRRTQEADVELARDVADAAAGSREWTAHPIAVSIMAARIAAVDDAERVEVKLAELEARRRPGRPRPRPARCPASYGRGQGQGAGADGLQDGETVLGGAGHECGCRVLPVVRAVCGCQRTSVPPGVMPAMAALGGAGDGSRGLWTAPHVRRLPGRGTTPRDDRVESEISRTRAGPCRHR